MTSNSGPTVSYPSSDSKTISGNPSTAIHNDGIDYIKQQTFGASSGTTTSAGLGSVPSSNPGAEDTTGGIASSHGGVSKTAQIGTPVSGTETSETTPVQDQTILGSIKSVLFGTGESTTTTTESTTSSLPSTAQVSSGASHYGSVAAAGAAGVGASAAAGVASLTGSTYAADSAKSLDQTKQSYEQSTGVSTGTGLASSSPLPQSATTGAYTSTAPYDSGNAGATSTAADTDISATTIDPSTTNSTTHADLNAIETRRPADTDTTSAEQASADDDESASKPHAAGGHTGPIENPSAIPTAGGQRLGKAHEGESKIVPDVPKLTETGDLSENTAKNTGAATGGPGAVPGSGAASASDKEKLSEKIKDKLHLGSHKS